MKNKKLSFLLEFAGLVLAAIFLVGCGRVEVDTTVSRIAPGFLLNLIASGFWGASFAMFIFVEPFVIVGLLLRKVKILNVILMGVPGCLFTFYIWHIRGQVAWLVFGIIAAIGFISTLIGCFKKLYCLC